MPDSSGTLFERKHRDILAAAVEEFREHGFGSARVDRIAERAKVSKRTLYKHFPSKDALFDGVLRMSGCAMPASFSGAYDPARDIRDQLRAALDGYLEVIAQDSYIDLSRVIIAEFIHDPERTRAAAAAVQPENQLERLVEQAMRAGALRRADPAYAATQLVAPLKSFFFWPRFLMGTAKDDPDYVAQVRDDCLAMFLAHYAPDRR